MEATTRSAIALGRVICERDSERAHARDAALLAEQGGEVKTTFRQNMIQSLRYGLQVESAATALERQHQLYFGNVKILYVSFCTLPTGKFNLCSC